MILQRVRTRRRAKTEMGGFSGHAGEDQAPCCRIQLLGFTANGLDKEEDGSTLRDEMMQCATAGGGGPGGGHAWRLQSEEPRCRLQLERAHDMVR